jgi:hypothetical protein
MQRSLAAGYSIAVAAVSGQLVDGRVHELIDAKAGDSRP